MPGVATPSDLEAALELGCRHVKFFPAEPCGGLSYLRNMSAPYAHLGVRFVPLGGLSATNSPAYLREPAVLAVGGSWIASRKMIQEEAWETIRANAIEVHDVVSAAPRRKPLKTSIITFGEIMGRLSTPGFGGSDRPCRDLST